MSKKLYIISAVILLATISFFLGWGYLRAKQTETVKNINSQVNQDIYTKDDHQGEISVSAKWLNPLETNAQTIKLQVTMNTHSVNLDQYELLQNSEVSIDNIILSGSKLEKQGGGHHLTLTLTTPIGKDKQQLLMDAKVLKLTLKNVDGATRVFTWNLK